MAQKGSLSFEDFVMMNQYVGIATPKKELKRTFDILDKQRSGRVRLEDVKAIASMLVEDDSTDDSDEVPASELKLRQELDDLYEQLKDRLEKRNSTLESIVFETLKYTPT